jgi:hypothetical protein
MRHFGFLFEAIDESIFLTCEVVAQMVRSAATEESLFPATNGGAH